MANANPRELKRGYSGHWKWGFTYAHSNKRGYSVAMLPVDITRQEQDETTISNVTDKLP